MNITDTCFNDMKDNITINYSIFENGNLNTYGYFKLNNIIQPPPAHLYQFDTTVNVTRDYITIIDDPILGQVYNIRNHYFNFADIGNNSPADAFYMDAETFTWVLYFSFDYNIRTNQTIIGGYPYHATVNGQYQHDRNLSLYVEDGKLALYTGVKNNGTEKLIFAEQTPSILEGKWYQIALTRSSDTGWRLYVNGDLKEQSTDHPEYIEKTVTFSVGRWGQHQYFHGYIYRINYYDTVLTQENLNICTMPHLSRNTHNYIDKDFTSKI